MYAAGRGGCCAGWVTRRSPCSTAGSPSGSGKAGVYPPSGPSPGHGASRRRFRPPPCRPPRFARRSGARGSLSSTRGPLSAIAARPSPSTRWRDTSPGDQPAPPGEPAGRRYFEAGSDPARRIPAAARGPRRRHRRAPVRIGSHGLSQPAGDGGRGPFRKPPVPGFVERVVQRPVATRRAWSRALIAPQRRPDRSADGDA